MNETKKRNIISAIDLAYRPYEHSWGLSEKEESEVIEVVQNLIAGLDYKDYRQVLDSFIAGRKKVLIQKARELALEVNKKSEVPNVFKKEDEESEQDRQLREEREFFFGKNNDNLKCNCGAAYTSFPNYHKDFCALSWKKSLS